MSNQATDLHFGKTPLTPSHGDSLVDQSFQSLKSKEIRDSLSPTHEVKFRNSGGIGGGVLVPDTTGWDVKTSSEVSPDGRAFRTETMAHTDGVEKLPGGHAEFAGRNEHKSSASHQGDDKNYVKKAAESSKTHLQEKVVIGDENSGHTEVKSSSMTSSSKVTSSSSQQVFSSEDPGFDMQPRRLTQHHDHHQNMLQEANNVHSERQQYSRNERNERQETVRNTREESQKYVDMDKASPEYQQHVQYLMSQPGAIISNTVEYPKPGVKMITTVKKLPDGTTVKTKRYETEASAAGVDATSISQTVKQQQQQRTTSSTSTTQKSTEKRIQDSEDVFARLARTRDSNVPSNASPQRAPESPSTEDIHSRLQKSRNVNEQKFSDSIDQRSTQILRDNHQPQHPGARNAPMTRRPSDLVDNVEMISTTNKTVKKDLSQSVRSEKITSSDFIQNERDRYIHDQDRPSRPGPDGYPETLVPITPNRHGRPSQPGDDHPSNGYNATEVIKQSSSTKSSAKYSESRRYSTETVESYQDSLIDNQDHTTRGYPSNRRPNDEPSRRSPSGGRPDFSTHGFPSVRSDKPTQQYSSDRPRPQDDYPTERVHTDRPRPSDDTTTTTRSNYSTNETRSHVTTEDFSTHGFPSVRAGTPTRDSPRRPLGSEPSPGESPKRPSGQEPKSSERPSPRPQEDYTTSTERVHTIHTDRPRPGDDSTTTTRSNYSTNETRRHVTKEDFSTHGFPSVRAGTPTRDSPRRPLGSEPSPGESPKRPSGQEPPSHQVRKPPSDGFSTHGFPSVKTGSPTDESPRRPSSGPEPTHHGRRPTTEDFSTHGFPSVKPGRSTPTQSAPQYETPNRVDREDNVSVTSDRSNSVIYEKKIDAAHAAFARSLRCASPVESPRRDSTSDRHTPRSSVGSIRNSYSPSKSRDGRSPSRDSVTNSESSRISSATVTKTHKPTEVRRVSHPKSPIGKSSPSHVSNETIDLTLTRKITAKPSPDKASSKPTPADRSPSDIRPAPQSTTPHNIAPKSTKDKVKSPSTTTSSPSPRSTSPLKVDNSTSRFTKTVNRDTNTTTKTKRHPDQEPESDREPLHEPEDLDEGYVPDRKGRRRPNSQRPTSDDEGFEPESPRAGSPTSDFEYRRPEQVETFDEEDSVIKKTRRTDNKVVTNDFLNTERNVPKSKGPEGPVDGPSNGEERPKRPDREGRRPSNLVGKPTEPQDHKRPEDHEPKRPLRRPKEEDTDHKLSPKDRKPSQLTDEPRNYEPDEAKEPSRKPSYPKEPLGADDKPSGPLENSRPKGAKPPLERSETFEERCRQILGMDSETIVDRTKKTQEFIETERTTVDSTRSDRSPSPAKKEPSDNVRIEDCDDDDDVETRRKYPSKTTTDTTRGHPREKSPHKPSEYRPNDRYPDSKLPKHTAPSEFGVTDSTTTITDERSLSPERKSPRKSKPDDVRPKDRSPSERPGKIDETTTIYKTTKIVDEINERSNYPKPGSRPKDQSLQGNQPSEKTPTSRRTPSPQKNQPRDTVSIEDCEDDEYTNKTANVEETTWQQTRDKSPNDKKPRSQSPVSRLPKDTTTNELNERITTERTTKTTDDRSPSPKRMSPKQDDDYPRGLSPLEQPERDGEISTFRKTTKIVDQIDDRKPTNSKPGSLPKDQYPRESQPKGKSPEIDSGKRTFITTRETTFDVETSSDKSPTRSLVRGTSPVEKLPRDRSPTKAPARETSPSDKSPRKKSPVRGSSPTDDTVTITTTHSTITDGVNEDRYPSYTPKGHPYDHSPFDKPRHKPKTTDKEDVTIDTSKKTKKTTTEEIHDDVFKTKRPNERQPDTRDGSFFSQPRDQSPSEREPRTSRPKGDDFPRDKSPEKPTIEETECMTTKQTSKIISDTIIGGGPRPKEQPRDRSPSKKPTTEDTNQTSRPRTHPREEFPLDDLTRPSSKTTTRRVDKTSAINDFLDTERKTQTRPKRPEEDKPSQPREKSPTQKPKGPTVTDLDESTVTKTTKTTKDTKRTNEVEELFPSSRPRDRSPTEKPIRNPRIVTTDTTTEYGITSRPRSESPVEKPKKPIDSEEIDETFIRKTKKITEDTTITTDLDQDTEKPSRRPRPSENNDQPREKSPVTSKPSDRSPSPRLRYLKSKEPLETGATPRSASPIQKPQFTDSTDEETSLVITSKITNKIKKTQEDVEDVDIEDRPRGKSPEKPKGSKPTEQLPREPTEDSDYEETLVKRRNKTTRNETTFEEKANRSPRNYHEEKPREKSPSSKPRAQKPAEDSDDEYQRPFGKSKPRDSSPLEGPRKPIIGENLIIQTTSIRKYIPEDRHPKGPQGIAPEEKPGPGGSPRETSPKLKSRKPGMIDESYVEETTTESTTIKDRIQKSPRLPSPSEKPDARDYPRGKSPNADRKKPSYDDNVVEQITTETTIINDHSTKSPREPSLSEKPEPTNYPRDRSPNEKPMKPRYDEIVTEKTSTESTLVKDRLTKSPRERSPSNKPGPRDSPRDRSPREKPRKPWYDDTVIEQISSKSTTIRDHSPSSPKSPRRSSPSEKYGPRDSPRDTSPNDKLQESRYDETVVEKITTESTILKDRLTKSPRGSSPTEKPRTRDHPRDMSPTDKQRKPTVDDQGRPRGASPTKKPESRRPTDEKPDETYLRETIREGKTVEETIIDECCPEHQLPEKSPLGKPKGSKPVAETTVVKRLSKTTPVNDYSSKTPRGPSPTKSSPQERSPTQKSPLTKGSPRTTSPTEKPTKRQPIVSESGKTIHKITSKFNKDIKTSEKIIVKDHPRRKSPSDKPRRNRPTSDEDTDDDVTETIIAVYTIDGDTVEEHPHDLSPKKCPHKPSDSSPKKPQTNGHFNHPRGISPTEKPKQRQPTDEEIEELFISTSRVTKNRETVEKTRTHSTRDQPRDMSPSSGKPRGRQPTDESIDTTVIQKTRRRNRDETSLEETEYQFPEDRPGHRSPSQRSPHRAYPREPSPTTEETILYTTEVTTKIGNSPRDRSPTEKPRESCPSGKPSEPRSYPRDKSPTDKLGPRIYPRDKSPSDKPNRSRPGYLEETSNTTTNVRQIVQQTEKQNSRGRPVSQSPAEKPSTLRRPSKISTTTPTTTNRNRSSIDEQRTKTQPSTRDKLPTKTLPVSSPKTQPTVDRRVPAELPSPNRKPKSTFGVTTKTTTSTVTKSPVAPRPKATTESPKKPLKFPLESRPGARPTERKTAQSISPDSSPSRAGSDFENDSQKSPSPTRSVKLEDITTTVSTAKKTTIASDKSEPTVRHVTTAKIQITPPTSPIKMIGTPEVKLTASPKKPSSRVPTPKPHSKADTRTTTTRKITNKINKDGIIPTDSEDRDSEVPSDIEEVDTPTQQKPSTRKLPVTERKESAPVHRVTKINKDVQMSRSTSENIIKTPITKRPSRHEPLEPQREVPNLRPTTGDRSSPKSERRPSKHLSTKTINLTTFDKIINSEDMENVVIDIQHAKSSREPSPNKIVPTPVSVDTYTGKPRYPDVVQEPEDEPKKKPVVKNIPIFEEETNEYVRCQITEINEERLENSVRARTTKFIEKEASPQRQAPRIVTGDNVDSECLLSVHDKVSKFITTAEEVSKPKTSAPFRRDLPEQDMPEDDECLLTVDEKVSKFLKTADSVTKEVVTSKPRRVERPSIEDLDEDLRTDECVLSVSEKVNKFTTKAEKLAPSAPQRSPELVARIERQISRPSDAEPESPESEDSPASVRKFKPSSPLTERTDKKYTDRQIDILSRPSVWEKKAKPDVKLDDIISAKPEDEVPQKSRPLKSTDSVSKRKELFESKVSNKTTVTTKEISPEKRPTRPSNSPSERRPSDVSDSRCPNEFTPRYVDGYPHQEPDDDVHEDVYGSSKTRRVYESSNRESTIILRSPERSPTRKTTQPENRPSTLTQRKSPRQTEEKNPSRRYSEDQSSKYPTRDQFSTDRYTETTHESSENTSRRRSSTQEYSDHKTSYNGVPRSPLRKQPSEEPEDFSTFSTRRDETTTHYTTRTVPHSPKDSPLTPTSFLDDDEEHDHSPARSTSTVSSHKQTSSTHRTTSTTKRVIEDSSTRRPRRPSGNEPTTPTTPGSRTPRTRVVPETVAARRNIFEKTPGNVSPLPTGRRPSYMEPTKSSLEHRKDSLEVTKTNFSRKSSVEEEPYEPSPRASVKFGVGLKHKEEPKPKRKLSSSDIPNIEDVFELELLEEMLNVVSSYEQRRRIRAQIRVVKKLLETKTKEEVSSMTRITTIRKTSASSVRESPTPKKETPVRPTEKYQLTDDDIDSESIVKSRHVEEREEIIQERSISPQSRTSRVVTKVTEVRKIAEPSTPTNKRTPLKKDEPKDSKPIWATKNILKKPSENEKVTRALSAKKTTSTSSSSTSRTQQQTSRQRVAIDDDCVTSSYGIGPTDEDGRPLFGIRALKKKTNTSSTNSTVQPSETTKVTGTVITEKYYSENGAEPVGERKVTVYSTNPEELVDMENQYDRRDSETVKREKLSKDGLTTVTKVQKIGNYSPGEIPSLTDDTEFTKTSSKMVRRGSVKEMSEKFIRKESSSSVTEKSSGYPKAGLILRTRRNSGATADTADQYEARAKSTEYDYDSEENVEIRTSRKHSKVVTESDDETEIRRRVNTRSFLNSAGSKVTGVDDVLERMRNADNVEVDGDTIEDREARSLLNKFLGASVLMSGMESMIPQMELRKTTTSGADNKQEVKTTRVTKTIKSGTTGGSSSSPVARETCDFEEIWDEEILKQLLEKSTSYEERRSIRARLRQLMADREGQSTTTTEKTETKKEDGGVVTTTTKVTTRTITGAPKPVSPFAKFQQLDKQNSLQSPKSPNTPTTPGGSSTTPIFRFTDPALNARAATFKEQLLQWCQNKTQEYENVQITNFSASWTDGLAFCALIHHFLPDAFDYSKLTPKQRRYNFELAFRVADEKAGIAPLLDVEDMVVMKRPDWKCVFTYVQSIYRRFRNCQ